MNDMDRGPIFGKGHDIIIHDRSDKHENWNNLGMSYESSYKFGSKKANIQHKRSYIVIIHRESQTILASYYHLSYDHYIYPIKDNCQSTVNAYHNGCQAKDGYYCHHHHHDCYYQHDTY